MATFRKNRNGGELFFLVLFFLGQAPTLLAECVPARRYISGALTNSAYTRVHPDGNYVLASGGTAGVKVLDISGDKVKEILTPMNHEAYPVQGEWVLIASPNHGNKDTMNYYSFADILDKQSEAKPQFSDSEHNEYYHSSATLPGGEKSQTTIRTMLWSQGSYRDYNISWSDGKVAKVRKGPRNTMCKNGVINPSPVRLSPAEIQKINDQIGELRKTLEIYNQRNSTMAPIITGLDGAEGGHSVVDQLYREIQTLESKLDPANPSKYFAMPVLSKDGTEFATLHQGTTKIFKVLPGHKCEMVKDLGYATSKVDFSHPKGQEKGRIAFIANGKAYLYDRDLDMTIDITGADETVFRYSYPGFTKDGRLAYLARRQDDTQVVILDPHQIDSQLGPCIESTLAKEETDSSAQ